MLLAYAHRRIHWVSAHTGFPRDPCKAVTRSNRLGDLLGFTLPQGLRGEIYESLLLSPLSSYNKTFAERDALIYLL